ncbi:alpha/beta hydrolase family protein [Anaerocolumna xylanovorans]|nr:prolyl oligopeptidase family serine peptidase [Anaerocolumna xylanovorans]
MDRIDTDTDYLEELESYSRGLKKEYMDYVEYQKEDSVLLPADQILSYRINYKSGNETIDGYVAAPKDYMVKSYPVLIFNRGGNRDYGELDPTTIEFFARYGFITMGTQYRGGGESSGEDEFGGADVMDVIKLIDYAKKLDCTNGKLYLFGWSRGAMETYIVLSCDKRIDAAVAGAGITDLKKYYVEMNQIGNTEMTGILRELVGNPKSDSEEYEKRSAIKWPDKIDTPLYIVQGMADERVAYHHSEDLYEAMDLLGKDVKLTLYPGMNHLDTPWTFLDDYFYWLKQY